MLLEQPEYAELHCHSAFSLLDGASSPEALVAGAQTHGLRALALTDHDALSGAVRFWTAARRAGLHALIGAEITLDDGAHLTLLAETQRGYANLCRLLTRARQPETTESWPGKVAAQTTWAELDRCRAGLIALSGCRRGAVAAPLLRGDAETAESTLRRLVDLFGPGHLYVELQRHYLPGDDRLIRGLRGLARAHGLPPVATNNVHYATQAESPLRDCLLAIHGNETLTAARRAGRLPLNNNFYLAGPAEMARRFAELPEALRSTLDIAERCRVRLDFSGQRLPVFATPAGQSEFAYLYQLCHDNLPARYPQLRPRVLTQLAHELDIIERAGLAGYFLTVWDLVRFARERGIRCQGRGSAANSIVAYLLGITQIDPIAHNLLFERFLSQDKFTMPDIDIDFAADRREEVIQYVYDRYGREHAAMVCNVVTYRARSALRDLAKVLDFPPATIDRLAKRVDVHSPGEAARQLRDTLDEDAPAHHPLNQLAGLMAQIDGLPRHLSIHSGGMVITGPPLDQVVPLEPATLPGRLVCQWDKESVEDAGLIKIDLLGLRALGLVSEAVAHVAETEGQALDMDALPLDDPEIYAMLQRADTVGAFQVESRAQQQMLPRLRPQCFEDIAVQVAIVRPGPIQGGAVHTYLQRRAGAAPVHYAHPCLEPVLAETLGVLLFQEQAIRVAVVAAGFSPGEADLLRRALSRKNPDHELAALAQRFTEGAAQRGIDAAAAQQIFEQLAGFAGYGFCKSHAASFALIAYQTLYLKRYHPAAFYCALLNNSPMGFYPPEVVIHDARRHGVDLLPPDVQRSDWAHTIERAASGRPALRTGARAVHGLGEAAWQRIEHARAERAFADLADLRRRTRLSHATISALIRAGALDEFGERRQLLWTLGGLHGDAGDLELPDAPVDAALPALSDLEETLWEYDVLGLAPGTQLMAHFRDELHRRRILSTWAVKQRRTGGRVWVAGMVVIRQRPGTARGVTFVSLEDESGLLDLVIKPAQYDRWKALLRGDALILAGGVVQRSGRAVSLLVTELRALASDLHP